MINCITPEICSRYSLFCKICLTDKTQKKKNQETEAAEADTTSQLHDRRKISDYRYPPYFDAVANEAVSKYNNRERVLNTMVLPHLAID